MREEIKQLVQLQELDATVRKLSATRQQLQKDAASAEQGVKDEQKGHEDRANEAKSFRKALDRRELELKELEGRIQKLETQLNTANSNKEYAAFQHEILGLRADKSRIEDEILKMYDQVEVQGREVKEAAARVAAAEQAVQERRKAIETAIADAEARLERVKKERAEFAARIPPSYLQPYERLAHKSGGKALAACRNYVCEGCRMSLTANTVNLLMVGDKLTVCHSCGRILYLPESEDLTSIGNAGRKEW